VMLLRSEGARTLVLWVRPPGSGGDALVLPWAQDEFASRHCRRL